MTVQNILDTIGSSLNLFKCLIKSKYTTLSNGTSELNVTILANGPSLKENLKKKTQFPGDVLVVNSFHKSSNFERLKPKHYLISAPEFWLPLESPVYVEMQNKLLHSFENKVDWQMTFYIPYKSKSFDYKSKIESINKNITVQYYNDTAIDSYKISDRFIMSSKLGMPRPHNVLIPSLMVCIWLGYKSITVYGADHSWLPEIRVLADNTAVLSQNHFYDKKMQDKMPMAILGQKKRKLHEILEKFYLSFKNYHLIKKYADISGVKIINATPHSFIDAFPRKGVE